MENSMTDFVALLEALNCEYPDVKDKLQCYPKVRQLLDSKFVAGETIKDDDIFQSLYDCIFLDLEVDDVEVQYAALQTIEHFFKFNWTRSLVKNITHNLTSLAFDEKYKSRPDIKIVATSYIKGSLREFILHSYCDLEKLCPNVQYEDKAKVFELFEEVLLDLGTTRFTQCLTFFYDVLIQQMYITNDPELRTFLVKPTKNLINKFKFNRLSSSQIESFKGKVCDLYHPQITKLQKKNDPNWSHLWMFLLKYMGKVLFETAYIPLMNSLLKNIENSFRGPINDKLAAFDCWQTLIDNYGNDKQRMAAVKQINLVLTPLRRILSREEIYVAKRFETFCHLINVFQENSADVYLPILLSFCFYTFTETYENDEKIQISFVRKIPSLREKGIQVLVELLGHYGHNSQECVLNTNDSCIKLKKPLITAHNYVQHRIHIKNSIVECALVMLGCVNKELVPKGIKCLWGALFSIISQLDARQQEIELKDLATVILGYGKSNDNTDSYHSFFLPILELFVSNRFVDTKLFVDVFLLPLIKDCVHVESQSLVRNSEVLQNLITACINEENKGTWIKEVCDIFEKVSLDSLNIKFVVQIWLMFNKSLLELAKASMISEILVDQYMLFLVPVLEKIPEAKKANMVSKKWGLLFMQLCHVDKKYEDLVKKLHNSMKALGVFQSSAILFLPGMDCFFHNQTKAISEFLVTSFLCITNEILQGSNIKQDHILTCCACITNISDFYTSQVHTLEDSAFRILCRCYELLCAAKKFENLKLIDNLFDICTKERREIVSQTLLKAVSGARTNEDKEVAQFAIVLTAKLSNKSKKREQFLIPKISSPKTAVLPSKSPKMITLFGQAVEAKSPQVKESQPSNGNSTKSIIIKKKKAAKRTTGALAINDENSENFVPINGGYIFEAEKLTEHQMEVLKKARTDIPALYQDLSQSQSNSQVFFDKMQKASSSAGASNGSQNEITKQSEKSENETTERSETINESTEQSESINESTKQNESENESTKQSGSENGVSISNENDIEALESELKNLLESSIDISNKPASPTSDTSFESVGKLLAKKKPGRIKSQRLSAPTDDTPKISALTRKSLPSANTRIKKLQKELAKIKMDIVGGEQFTKHLNLSDKIQTRRSGDFGTRSKTKKFAKPSSTRKGRTTSLISPKNYMTKKEDRITKTKSRLFAELTQGGDDLNKKATTINSIGDDLHAIASLGNELPKSDDLITNVAKKPPIKSRGKPKRRHTVESIQSDELNKETKVSIFTTEMSSSEKPPESTKVLSKKPKRISLIRVDDSTIGNIPREPNQSDDKIKQESIDSKLSNLSHELSITLVNKPPPQNSEDVIESSQDTFVEIVPLKSSSSIEEASTSSQPDPKESSMKETISPNKEINSCSSIFTNPSEDAIPVVAVDEEVIEIKDSENEMDMDNVRVDSPDELIRRDLISNVIKSLDTAEMDTETCDAQLEKICSTSELPTSPLRPDTPSRTKELMDNTINISPIKTLLQLDCNMEEKIQKAQKLFNIDMDDAASSEPEALPPINGGSRTAMNGNSRGAKLLNSIGYKSPMVNTCKNTNTKSRSSFVPALKPSRVTKMMQNCGGDTANTNLEKNCEEDCKQFGLEKDIFPEKDVLKFVRTLPSPMASPRFGILKRKAPDTRDEDVSPPRKQTRRVNFSDPPTTSEKVFFLDNGEENMKRLKSNESLFTELFNENRTDAKRMAIDISESNPELMDMETQATETQGSVDVTDPTRLDSDIPIFEDLVDCDERVEKILEFVTSAIFEKTLLNELNARNIKSVGDLAKLSEREVNRLPFRVPKVETVRRVLSTFKKSLVEIQTDLSEEIFPGPSTSKAAVITPLPESEEQNNLEPSFPILSTSKVESGIHKEGEEDYLKEKVSKEKSYQDILNLIPKEDLKNVAFNILDEIQDEDIKDIAFKILDKMKSSEIMTYFSKRLERKGD